MVNEINRDKTSFLDPVFRFFRNKPVNDEKPVGVAGTPVYGGFVSENEKLAKLMGRQKYITYSDMLANTEIVATGVRYFLNILVKSAWKVEPPEDGGEQAEEYAELIQEMMEDMKTPWHRVVRRAAMYRFYGFSVQEWTAKKRDDGNIGIADINPRAQFSIYRWDTNSNGDIFGVVQQSPQTGDELYIPRDKVVYVVDDSLNDSPEGLGIFRHASIVNDRVNYYLELEGYGFETDLRGIPVGRGPYAALAAAVTNGTINAAQKVEIEQGMTAFIQNHIKNPELGLLLDSSTYRSEDDAATPSAVKQWDIELLKGSSTSQGEMNTSIMRELQSLARLLGVENLMLGQVSGNRSLSEDKSKNLALVVDSTLKELTEVFQKDFVERIFELNGWDKKLLPTYKTEAVRFRDIEQVTSAIRDLAQAGAPIEMNDPIINDVRNILGVTSLDLEAMEERMELEDEMRLMLGEEQALANSAAEIANTSTAAESKSNDNNNDNN